MLKEKVLEYYKNLQDGTNSPLRMSSAGKCARALSYAALGYISEPLSGESKLIFEVGHQVEKAIVIALESLGIISEVQKELTLFIGGLTITGHIDFLMPKTSSNDLIVVDVKSMNRLRAQEAYTTKTVDYGYLCQGECYMRALNCNQMMFLCFNKAPEYDSKTRISYPLLHEVFIESSDQIWGEVQRRFDLVAHAIKTIKPAPKEYTLKSDKPPWQCAYCEFASECWKGEFKRYYNEVGKPKMEKIR